MTPFLFAWSFYRSRQQVGERETVARHGLADLDVDGTAKHRPVEREGVELAVLAAGVCTPALLVTLTAAAAIGSVPFSIALLGAFGLRRSVLIALGAVSLGWLESFKAFTRWQKAFEVIGGLVLMASGAYLINEYFAPMAGA